MAPVRHLLAHACPGLRLLSMIAPPLLDQSVDGVFVHARMTPTACGIHNQHFSSTTCCAEIAGGNITGTGLFGRRSVLNKASM